MRLHRISTKKPVPSSTNEAADALIETYHSIRRYLDRELGGRGLSLSRIKLLMILDADGPTRSGVLASRLGIAPRSVTDAVDSLARDGLVERAGDPLDRRAVLTRITRSGTKALRDGHRLRKKLLDGVFAPVTSDQRSQLVAALAVVRASLESAS